MTTSFLEIDGSFGEGGGQTVRLATAFSIILERPIHLTRVRAGRKVPGLRPQHSVTLKILSEVCGGVLKGGEVGSTEFSFVPGHIGSRSVTVDTGTAASVTLALQAIVPAVSLSGSSLDIDITGGTDVPWSPTCDYFSTVFLAGLRRAGIRFTLEVGRRGYYPNGGGRVRARIEPCTEVRPLDLTSRVEDPPISIVSRAGMLPARVAEQLLSSAASELERNDLRANHKSSHMEQSYSPGCSVMVGAVGESCFIGADSIGVRGKPAFLVGSEAGARFARYYKSRSCVDPHLADMLAPLLFLARGPSKLLTPEVTEHLRTSLHVASLFVDAEYSTKGQEGGHVVSIAPRQQNS